jgi:hypothetical protein
LSKADDREASEAVNIAMVVRRISIITSCEQPLRLRAARRRRGAGAAHGHRRHGCAGPRRARGRHAQVDAQRRSRRPSGWARHGRARIGRGIACDRRTRLACTQSHKQRHPDQERAAHGGCYAFSRILRRNWRVRA